MPRHQYKRPPVAEAICQIQLAPTDGFSILQLAHLPASFSAMYPGKPKEQQTAQGDFSGGFSEDGAAELRSHFKIVRKTLFPSEDGTRFVAVRANELSIHTLSPYDGWDPFRERIAGAIHACRDVHPLGRAQRIAVRYTNRVSFPAYNVPLNTYFTKAPEYPDGVPVVGMTNFFSRVECEYPDDSIRLVILIGDVGPKRIESPTFLLDVEVAWANSLEPLAIAAALPKIEDLKEKVSVAFESSVTDKARRAFDVD